MNHNLSQVGINKIILRGCDVSPASFFMVAIIDWISKNGYIVSFKSS